MNALLPLRSRRLAILALSVALVGALAALAPRFDLANVEAGSEFLLFCALGVALGRLTVGIEPAKAIQGEAKDAARMTEAVDQLVRSVAKLIQAHLKDSDAYSERLHGATSRLAQHPQTGPINDIVLALIEDNRAMRDRLENLRHELEESRRRALQLENDLVRSEEAGMRDPVTMIGNRRYFDAALAEELERAHRAGADFCLALADLDRFKLVNDRFGHLVGDRLLRLFAEILTRNVRNQDRVARFGGEEFAVILPGASLEEAVKMAERVRKDFWKPTGRSSPMANASEEITVSFGVTQMRPDETAAELLKRTDERLYDAKAKGRNCVVADSAPDDGRLDRTTRIQRVAIG